MRATCPYCGRQFIRSARGLVADRFCHHCVIDRIKASGGKVGAIRKVESHSKTGYFVFSDQN